MKLRTGFVSNSSSSSFCVIGYCINYTRNFISKFFPEIAALEGTDYNAYEDEMDGFGDKLRTLFSESPLDITVAYDREREFGLVGVHIFSVDDNQTLGEVKNQIKNDSVLRRFWKDQDPEILIEEINS